MILGQVSEHVWKGYLTVNDGPVLEVTQTCIDQENCLAGITQQPNLPAKHIHLFQLS